MYCFFFFKQKTAYEMRISDWSSDVCSSDLHAGADRMARVGAGAGGNGHRQHAHDEGERGHQDRTEAQARGLDHRLAQRPAELALLDRELDDQDRVLRRQADHRDQADLEVDVRSEEHTSELQSLMRISYAVFCLK